ncbi:Uu.00g036550.m01.CDS01 [Anthostomella pinea]|uniref:Uu.00g036550.m01.CDS01 n=1 Tax=Anthostomella pinea TaxID=933095 RepID=A0AAI8VA35_9PEZI|nr:Uu.00g036550.m01.CDS01 [Anthostomella pinea]
MNHKGKKVTRDPFHKLSKNQVWLADAKKNRTLADDSNYKSETAEKKRKLVSMKTSRPATPQEESYWKAAWANGRSCFWPIMAA